MAKKLILSVGSVVRFDGRSADGSVGGFMAVHVLDPHSNACQVTHSSGGREYERAYAHLPTATVERPATGGRPAKVFEAFVHTLRPEAG